MKNSKGIRVYGMGRVPCYCPQCGGEKVWKIIAEKGETPVFENDYGQRHFFVAAPETKEYL